MTACQLRTRAAFRAGAQKLHRCSAGSNRNTGATFSIARRRSNSSGVGAQNARASGWDAVSSHRVAPLLVRRWLVGWPPLLVGDALQLGVELVELLSAGRRRRLLLVDRATARALGQVRVELQR